MRRAVQGKLKSNPFFRFPGLIIGLLVAISLQTGHPVAAVTDTPTGTGTVALSAETHFVPLLPDTGMTTNVVELQGIPFHVVSTDRGYQSFLPGTVSAHNRTFSRLFFLGLATDRSEGSEWWGFNERWYSQRNRVFIGDQLGRIQLIYQDKTTEIIPLIFGVNVWFYELITPLKPGEEKYLNNYGATSPEPFASDAHARALLDESLLLMTNDTVKGGRFIFGLEPQAKPLESIGLLNNDIRASMPQVTAITGLEPGLPPEALARWKSYPETYFTQRRYYTAMDRLARRLYQFRDELPATTPFQLPEGYVGPRVEFKGTPLAELYTRVYGVNIWDMARDKVDAGGGMHTSSKNAPSFGIYIGFGTFREQGGSYYDHIWSRDVGRSLTEVASWGETNRTRKAAERLLQTYLYDKSTHFSQPNWKRMANAAELAAGNNPQLLEFVSGKENDGHGALMLFLYRLALQGTLDHDWIKANWKHFTDAAEWYGWQIEHPEKSGFNQVLSSESEASTQQQGSQDLFSNAQAYHALRAFARLARQVGEPAQAERWDGFAQTLKQGIMNRFTSEHPRYGRIFVDIAYDCWTWEYKAQAMLFLHPDLFGYDAAQSDPELYAIACNTYNAQKEDYFSYAAGRQMGYGQGYITEAAILTDNAADMQGYLEQAAAFCYHHTDHPYIVPEGVIYHPSGRFWFRNGDLGNGVQQAEIVKCARLLIGLDDLSPDAGLSLVSRLPQGWTELNVKGWSVTAWVGGMTERIPVDYAFHRTPAGYSVSLTSPKPLKLGTVRLGPWPAATANLICKLNGHAVKARRENINGQAFVYIDLQGKTFGRLEAGAEGK